MKNVNYEFVLNLIKSRKGMTAVFREPKNSVFVHVIMKNKNVAVVGIQGKQYKMKVENLLQELENKQCELIRYDL